MVYGHHTTFDKWKLSLKSPLIITLADFITASMKINVYIEAYLELKNASQQIFSTCNWELVNSMEI